MKTKETIQMELDNEYAKRQLDDAAVLFKEVFNRFEEPEGYEQVQVVRAIERWLGRNNYLND